MQAIVRAASDRQIISRERYTSLYKQFSARGWRRDEPEPIPVEQPTVWPMALDVHRSRHRYTDQELADIARLTLDDLQSLFPHSFQQPLRLVGGSAKSRRQPQVDRIQPA
jgi:hypothetical protein